MNMNPNFEKTPKSKTEQRSEKPSFSDKVRKTFMGGVMGVAMMTGIESQAQDNSAHDNMDITKTEYVVPKLDSLYTPQSDWYYIPGSDTAYTRETDIPGVYEVYTGSGSGGKFEFTGYNDSKDFSGNSIEHPASKKIKLEKSLQALKELFEKVKDPEIYAEKMLKFQETPEFFIQKSEKIINIYNSLIKHFELQLSTDHYSEDQKNKKKESISYWQKGIDFLKTATPEQVQQYLKEHTTSEHDMIVYEFKKEIKTRDGYINEALTQRDGKNGISFAEKYNGRSVKEIKTLEEEIRSIEEVLKNIEK